MQQILDVMDEHQIDLFRIRSSFSRKKNRHLIVYLVQQIGLLQKSATILVNVHQCSTKAEVLQLLTTDQNDHYRHIFIPNQTKAGFCEVCDAQQQLHSLISEQLIEKALQKISQQYESQQSFAQMKRQNSDSQKVLCQICYINYNDEEIAQFFQSKHNICISCLGAYIDEKIISMEVQSTCCPHCGVKLSSEIIKKFASQKSYLIYQQCLKNAQIQRNPNLMWCPNPKCSVVISIKNRKKIFECPKCSFKICPKCNRQGHSGRSCNSVFKSEIKNWQNSKDIQKCKKCYSIVQKVSGCNHMSCTVCGHEWCWLCGANYSQRHFNPFNPFGCAGMQDRHGIGKFRIFLWRIVLFFIILVTLPCVLPFGLLFSGPFVVIETLYKKVQYENNRVMKFLAVVSGLIIGLIFDPFIWIGLIIVYFPRLAQAISSYFENRRRRIQNAQNRLNQRLINDAIVNSQNIVYHNNNNS